MPATRNKRTTASVSISLEPPLLGKGRIAAKWRRQSFSSYVATLIEADIKRLVRKDMRKR